MHAVKGSWIGQTFALSKSNESGGKKSRIRRSKEERKEMVVSFIKKYQSLNNGSFPSLNLTHKEVGGSFYTVREIVRDIIQENRVLGPAKLLPEHNNDQLLEKYPLGTLSFQPCTSLTMSPNGSPSTPDQHEGIDEEPDLISDALSVEAELQGFDSGKVIYGNNVVMNNEELVKQKPEKGHVSELLEAGDVKEVTVSKAKMSQVTDVIVETFPLRPVIKPPTDYYSDGNSDGLKDLDRTLEEENVGNMHLGPGNDISSYDNSSSSKTLLVDVEVDKPAGTFLEKNCEPMDEKIAGNLADPMLGSSSSSTSQEDIEFEKPQSASMEKILDLVDEKPGKNPVEIIDPTLEPSDSSSTEDVFVHEESTGTLSAQRSGPSDGKSRENPVNSTLEASNLACVEADVAQDTQVDLNVETVAESKIVNTSGVEAKSLDDTYVNGKAIGQDAVVESENNGQLTGGPKRGSKPTLSRVNVESCQAPSGNPAEPGTNPILAVFKSFIAALVKFFSE